MSRCTLFLLTLIFNYRMTLATKILAVLILVLTCIPILAFGKFDNEFLRLNIICTSVIFTYFSNEHYVIRLIVIQFFIIHNLLGFNYTCSGHSRPWLSLHERIHNAACMLCYGYNNNIKIMFIDMCKGGSTFNELSFLKTIKVNNGLVLVDGRISFEWQNV